MASVDQLKALVSSRLGFARTNSFLVTIQPLGPGNGLSNLLRKNLGDTAGTALSGFAPSVPGLTGNNIPDGNELNILCKNASLPGKQILTTDRKIGMTNEKVAYGYAVSDISLTFYVLNDYGILNYLEEWQKLVLDEELQIAHYKKDYARTVTIHQLRKPLLNLTANLGPIRLSAGIGGQIVYSVELINAFPTTISQIDFSNDLDGLVEITVSLSYTRHKRVEKSSDLIEVVPSLGQIF